MGHRQLVKTTATYYQNKGYFIIIMIVNERGMVGLLLVCICSLRGSTSTQSTVALTSRIQVRVVNYRATESTAVVLSELRKRRHVRKCELSWETCDMSKDRVPNGRAGLVPNGGMACSKDDYDISCKVPYIERC